MNERTVAREALEATTHGYVGFCPCGCESMVAATMDIPGDEHHTAKTVQEFVREGYRVHRMAIENVRKQKFQRCPNRGRGPTATPDSPQLEIEGTA